MAGGHAARGAADLAARGPGGSGPAEDTGRVRRGAHGGQVAVVRRVADHEGQPGQPDHHGEREHHGHRRQRDRQRQQRRRTAGHRGDQLAAAAFPADDRPGHAEPGPRVGHARQAAHRDRRGHRQPPDRRGHHGQRDEVGEQPVHRPGRRQGPPPGPEDAAVAQRQRDEQHDRHRSQEGPGEREDGHPERHRRHRGQQQAGHGGEPGRGRGTCPPGRALGTDRGQASRARAVFSAERMPRTAASSTANPAQDRSYPYIQRRSWNRASGATAVTCPASERAGGASQQSSAASAIAAPADSAIRPRWARKSLAAHDPAFRFMIVVRPLCCVSGWLDLVRGQHGGLP